MICHLPFFVRTILLVSDSAKEHIASLREKDVDKQVVRAHHFDTRHVCRRTSSDLCPFFKRKERTVRLHIVVGNQDNERVALVASRFNQMEMSECDWVCRKRDHSFSITSIHENLFGCEGTEISIENSQDVSEQVIKSYPQ